MPQGLPPPPFPPGVTPILPPGVFVPDFSKTENDFFAAWNQFAKQVGPIASRRMNRATFYRARLKQVVS